MEERSLLYISAILGALVILLSLLILSKSLLYSTPDLKCETLKYSGDPSKKINIVFFLKDVPKDAITEYIDSLFNFAPFAENKEMFNFFYVDSTPECTIENSALLCYSSSLLKASSVCPNDFIAVISKNPPNIRSSAYVNVISLNSESSKNVFVHEFGHVFANLADEYVPAAIPWRSKNCVRNCNEFEGVGGCFEGCSKEEYFRSEDNSIMRTLRSKSFGNFNEKIIKEVFAEY